MNCLLPFRTRPHGASQHLLISRYAPDWLQAPQTQCRQEFVDEDPAMAPKRFLRPPAGARTRWPGGFRMTGQDQEPTSGLQSGLAVACATNSMPPSGTDGTRSAMRKPAAPIPRLLALCRAARAKEPGTTVLRARNLQQARLSPRSSVSGRSRKAAVAAAGTRSGTESQLELLPSDVCHRNRCGTAGRHCMGPPDMARCTGRCRRSQQGRSLWRSKNPAEHDVRATRRSESHRRALAILACKRRQHPEISATDSETAALLHRI